MTLPRMLRFKHFAMLAKIHKTIVFLMLFISISVLLSASFAVTMDPYSGLEIKTGEATLYYMTTFDNACEEYSAELTSDELYAAIYVYDAIGQLVDIRKNVKNNFCELQLKNKVNIVKVETEGGNSVKKVLIY